MAAVIRSIKITKRLKIREGDIFTFGETKLGVGQIVFKATTLHIVIFSGVYFLEDLEALEISKLTPLLAGKTMDARFRHGMWKTVRNDDYRHPIQWPHYVVPSQGTDFLVNTFGNSLRPATLSESKHLRRPHSRSPIGYEDMFWSLNGGGDWDPVDDGYLVERLNAPVGPFGLNKLRPKL
jgi:hypothetical protein